jgi:transposase-like protein
LGPNAAGLSATNIVRLKEGWKADYEAWAARDLSTKRYVYWWADGIYFNVRLDPERPCLLVLMGALASMSNDFSARWTASFEHPSAAATSRTDFSSSM